MIQALKPPLATLELVWEPVEAGQALSVRVDGTDLIELVRRWEQAHSPEPALAGGYDGLRDNFDFFIRDWSSDDQQVTLLGCSCGEAWCWPLLAQVRQEGDTVVWSDFRQPRRQDTWSYEGFGPFRFDARQYRAEVQAALDALPPLS